MTNKIDIDIESEIRKAFNKPAKNPPRQYVSGSGGVQNPEYTRNKISESYQEDKESEPSREERYTTQKLLEQPDPQVRKFLEVMYQCKCQICGHTFTKRNGDNFFIVTYIIPRENARFFDNPGNALCLCAEHFAQFHHGDVDAPDIVEQIKEIKLKKEGGTTDPALKIKLCGKECTIRFKEDHLVGLQEFIQSCEQ